MPHSPDALEEHFHKAFCDADVDFLFYIFVGNGIIPAFHRYVVIKLDGSNFPYC
jgi:hypothetical protein